MSYKYFTVLTDVGKQKLAEAIANETALDFTEMAVGDSNGTSYEPTSDMTALKHVTYRAAIGSMKINAEDKNIMEFEFVVPASTGCFYVREAGLYSSDGTLIAISRLPEQYKADMAEGAGSSMTVRILVAISSDAQIYITVPASITYATQTYVVEEFKKHKADSNPHEQYVLNEIYSDKIDELQEGINSKAASNHNHDSTYLKKTDASSTYATKEALNTGLAGKAASNHNHDSAYLKKTDASSTYATKSELNTGLAGKAASNHHHDSTYLKKTDASSTYATKSELNTGLAGKAASNHNHDSTYLKKTDSVYLPIGFIYFQLRNQSTPDVVFGTNGKWQDISSTYAGEFFRVLGGDSAGFGTKQNEGLPNISGEVNSTATRGYIDAGGFANGCFIKGASNVNATQGIGGVAHNIAFSASNSNSIYGASSHVTPYNSAIRVWKKVS